MALFFRVSFLPPHQETCFPNAPPHFYKVLTTRSYAFPLTYCITIDALEFTLSSHAGKQKHDILIATLTLIRYYIIMRQVLQHGAIITGGATDSPLAPWTSRLESAVFNTQQPALETFRQP